MQLVSADSVHPKHASTQISPYLFLVTGAVALLLWLSAYAPHLSDSPARKILQTTAYL